MTQTRSTNNLKIWWEATEKSLQLFLLVMKEGHPIPDTEIEDALQYFNMRIRLLENSDYPENARDIREQLLITMKNVRGSLQHRQQNNAYQAQLRLDMADASMEALRFRLIQSNILL